MPRKRTRAAKQVSPQVCDDRINYAKLKEDKEFKGSRSLNDKPEHNFASGNKLFKANEHEDQGHGLNGALAPQCADKRRWAGVLMSTNGFDNAPDLASALGIALKSNGKSSFRIDYERYRAFFDDQTISDIYKDQLIEMLFRIGHAFYDAGFAYEFANVDSSQACGKLGRYQDDSAACGQGVLSSPDITLREQFNLCAAE